MDDCPAHHSSTPWLINVGFATGSIVVLAGLFLLFIDIDIIKKNKPKKAPKLNEDEQKLYNILVSKDNSCYQSDLVNESGFSKVKVTRVLDRLEQKKVIDRHRRGMTNLVIVK